VIVHVSCSGYARVRVFLSMSGLVCVHTLVWFLCICFSIDAHLCGRVYLCMSACVSDCVFVPMFCWHACVCVCASVLQFHNVCEC
jgi:hypothetical protein